MEELRTDIYVAIRTASKTTKRKLVGQLPHIGDAATRELTDRILKSLEKYEISLKKDQNLSFGRSALRAQQETEMPPKSRNRNASE